MMINRKPGIYIPTLYFAEGLPYTIVMMMSGVFFKSLGASNVFIGLTSFLSLPWILKFAWAPLVDYYATKRAWIVVAQVVLCILIGAVGIAAPTGFAINASVVVLFAIAVASATQDIAIDGYYLDVLDERQKAFFVGVRSAAYKCAWLFGSGALVSLSGYLAKELSLGLAWSISFAICSLVLLCLSVFHLWYLPHQEKPAPGLKAKDGPDIFRVLSTYFQQPGIGAIVTYILLFRMGDAFMLKQAPNFLLDPSARGGLELSVLDVGIINGTVGVLFLLLGGIAGSVLISRGGLKKWLWPTAIIQNSAILLYWLLAVLKPGVQWVYVVNSLEQFSYGLGVAAYTVFLLGTVRSQFKAAHYAIATALMALGVMVPGALSGFLWEHLGYANFFLVSFLSAIPGIITIFYLPIWRAESDSEDTAHSGGYTSGISQAGQMGREGK